MAALSIKEHNTSRCSVALADNEATTAYTFTVTMAFSFPFSSYHYSFPSFYSWLSVFLLFLSLFFLSILILSLFPRKKGVTHHNVSNVHQRSRCGDATKYSAEE